MSAATTVALAASVVAPAGALAITATVRNTFVRTCSTLTHRCTGYHQTNGPYNPGVPSVYSTKYTWLWV